jgi:hypothetical protein
MPLLAMRYTARRLSRGASPIKGRLKPVTPPFRASACGGSIGNAAGALISGYYGVAITGGPGVLLNAGTVESTSPSGAAVAFSGGYDNRLIDDPGAVFVGAVRGGNKVGAPSVTTLELASGATTGTLAGLGTQFIGFGQVTVDAGAHWAWTSSSTVEANATLTNSGTLGGRVNLGAGVSLVNDGTMHTTAGPVAYSSAADTDVSITNVGLMSNSSGTSSAIALKGGGFVSNASSGSIISGGHPGVYIGGAIGTVFNQGSIFATGTTSSPGIALDAGGSVSNASGGTVSSKYSAGVYINGGAGTVVNAGLIETSDTHTAVVLETGGSITNQSGGTIIGTQHHGIYITGASGGTVVNDGSILGMGSNTGSSEIVLESGGFVSNASDGLISSESHVAIYAVGGGVTVLNTGKIVGGTGHTGVYLKGVIDTVQNSGSITGGANGIALENGGVVSNSSAGFVYGTNNSSVYMTVNAGLVVNAGKIQSGAKNGVLLFQGGTVENLAGGTIIGTTGGRLWGACRHGGQCWVDRREWRGGGVLLHRRRQRVDCRSGRAVYRQCEWREHHRRCRRQHAGSRVWFVRGHVEQHRRQVQQLWGDQLRQRRRMVDLRQPGRFGRNDQRLCAERHGPGHRDHRHRIEFFQRRSYADRERDHYSDASICRRLLVLRLRRHDFRRQHRCGAQ